MNVKLLRDLSNAYGAPGFEDEVNLVIREALGNKFKIEEDTMRNLRIYRKNHSGDKPVVMLDAHSDEVAFVVHAIMGNGSIKFLPLGSWSPQNIPAHKVKIMNREGQFVNGVVASKPPHFSKGADQLIPISDMVIDVGSSSYEETVDLFKIEIGLPILPEASFVYNEENGVMLGKAFDNRVGCGAVIETLMKLEGLDLPVDVVGAISTQEEVGTRGAKINAQKIRPDLAIVFEGTPADDTFKDAYSAQGVMKKGTQIRHMDRTMIANPRLIQYTKEIARQNKIPFQSAVREGGGTNAGVIHNVHDDVPCLVLGTPVRYAHTHYGYAALSDVTASIDLGLALIKVIDKDFLKKL